MLHQHLKTHQIKVNSSNCHETVANYVIKYCSYFYASYSQHIVPQFHENFNLFNQASYIYRKSPGLHKQLGILHKFCCSDFKEPPNQTGLDILSNVLKTVSRHFEGWVQDCSISIANALEILQSCTNRSFELIDIMWQLWVDPLSCITWCSWELNENMPNPWDFLPGN